MDQKNTKSSRGRPKIFDRQQVIDTAVKSYWAEGVEAVSINEICRRTNVSKPSLYREFGGQAGLQCAVLVAYADLFLKPIQEILRADIAFGQAIEQLIETVSKDHEEEGLPKGCLFGNMRSAINYLSDETKTAVRNLRLEFLNTLIERVIKAQLSSELASTHDPVAIAHLIDSQLDMAMRMHKENVSSDIIRRVLILAFTALK